MGNYTILGIETSCDETAAAVVKNGREVISNIVYSQIALHKEYGGVVPEIASRSHIEKLPGVVSQAVSESGGRDTINAIAVTYGPGLVGALLTGISFAKALAYGWNKPLLPVHHIAGHICANYISHNELTPPFLCLVISGGHTEIIDVNGYFDYKVMGASRDDAAGEAIDKAARLLGMPYPGGPNLQNEAIKGNSAKYTFPQSFKGKTHLDFSFSGPKTALMNMLNKLNRTMQEYNSADIAASFLNSISESLVKNTFEAAKRMGYDKIAVCGGVSANLQIREKFKEKALKEGITLYFPEQNYCTDNAAMIASAAYYARGSINQNWLSLNAKPVADINSSC